MKHLWLLITGLISGLLVGCATTHPGYQASSLENNARIPIVISAQNIDLNHKDSFQLIDVTLENKSTDWLRINSIKVVIDNPEESKLSVVMGKDLTDWAQAMSFRIQKENHNKELVKTTLLTAGAAAAIAGGSHGDAGLAAVGGAAVVGTSSWAIYDVINTSRNKANRAALVPENHLYQSYSVPAQMYLRRWVLINKPIGSVINKLVLKLETVDGEKDTYVVNLL